MSLIKISRSAISIVLIGLIASGGWTENLVIPAGTPVIVQLLEEINSGTHKKGDPVHLSVMSDVVMDGKTVIKAGTPADGQVESASQRFFAGIGGQIEISVQNTHAVDGTIVPLQFKKETHGGSSIVSIVLTVVCCLCFVFMRGENVKIDKGMIFNTTVLGPTEIKV